MGIPLKARLVKIGNSRGIRIPRTIIEQLQLREEVELSVEADQLVIRSSGHPREGWDRAFQEMARRGDDRTFQDMPVALSRWDEDEWEW